MQERHVNRKQYFDEQIRTTRKFVIPFIEEVATISEETTVLEIGCGEAGNLIPFLELGCKKVVGVDLAESKINNAKEWFAEMGFSDRSTFLFEDIYKSENLGQFDIIITRDVMEHIHDQERYLNFVKTLLKPGGIFFQGFPPWYNPFGGHQQVCKSKVLSKLPYFHLLPNFLYKAVLKAFGESDVKIENLLEIKETGISIERYQRLAKKAGYRFDRHTLYLFNPNYETKFGLKPRVCLWPFSKIPFFRNFYVTASYSILSAK